VARSGYVRLGLALFATTLLSACATSTATTVTQTKTVTTASIQTTTVTRQAKPPAPRVFVPQDGLLIYKPDTIALGASAAIEQIRWLSYGGATAVGAGVFPANDCKPNCAGGTITRKRVTVRLNRRILCRSVVAYQLIAIQGGNFDNTYDVIDTQQRC
jgi:hypothetical protein